MSWKRKSEQAGATKDHKMTQHNHTAKPVLARKPVSPSKGDPLKSHLKQKNQDVLTIINKDLVMQRQWRHEDTETSVFIVNLCMSLF